MHNYVSVSYVFLKFLFEGKSGRRLLQPGIEDHSLGPTNVREHFTEEELTLGKNRLLEVDNLVELEGIELIEIKYLSKSVVNLVLRGPRQGWKWGTLMMSSYSSNRDKTFWSSLGRRYACHPRIRYWDSGMTNITENAKGVPLATSTTVLCISLCRSRGNG